AAGGGAIVNVASLAGLQTFKSLNAYVASKHAAVGLTKNAALENKNIRVNGIAPGAVLTPMLGNLSQEEVDGYAASVPSGRLGTPQDIANVVAFLLSEEASFVNGAVIPVDGGQLVACGAVAAPTHMFRVLNQPHRAERGSDTCRQSSSIVWVDRRNCGSPRAPRGVRVPVRSRCRSPWPG
ncbi:SDR family NAD(P)-dependent oxidoreductase, partial [Streptomyces tendae]